MLLNLPNLAGERSPISQGYNITHISQYFNAQGKETRKLTKASGIRFIITVDAKATTVDPLKLALAIGSSLGYLGFGAMIVAGIAAIHAACCCKNNEE